MSQKIVLSLRVLTTFASCSIAASVSLSSCTPTQMISTQVSKDSSASNPAVQTKHRAFQLQSVHADEPAAPELATVLSPPSNPNFELQFQTGAATAGTIRIPEQGAFKVKVEPGNAFAILDADATNNHIARIQAPGNFDLYLRPEQATQPPLCQTGSGSTASLPDQMDQLVLNKINSLVAQGKSACTYLPPTNQRQNGNCNSTSTGFQCSGALNKTISAASCPEIAIYGGAMNINNALPNTKLFVATSNNLTINQSVQGVLTTRGNLNIGLNGSSQLSGVFVGGSSNNLNMSGTSKLTGLYSLANNSSLSANLNNSAVFEGDLCATGGFNFNRTSSSQTIYHPDVLSTWLGDVPNLSNLLCGARNNFYTQSTPLSCAPADSNPSMHVTDVLYGIGQSIMPHSDGSWYQILRRPMPIPGDWGNTEGQNYVLTFENHGTNSISTRWFNRPGEYEVPASLKVIPAVDCIQANPQGGYTAFLSFTNLMAGSVILAEGTANQLSPSSASGNLPTTFAAGQSPVYPNAPASVSFSGPQLSWKLGARTVTAQASDPVLKCPEINQSPELFISDVMMGDPGLSVVGKDAPGNLVPNFAGKDIVLTLVGTFKNSQHIPIGFSEFNFSTGPELLQQTFVGNEPHARVLLDDSILLEVTSVTATEIHAILRTKQIPDLYLKGLHRLSVEQGDWFTDTLIKVGEPSPPETSLSPEIQSVEILSEQPRGSTHLRLTGKNFMIYPKFSYATIDGEFGFGFQTKILQNGQMESIIHIPNPEAFAQRLTHTLTYASPFGVSYIVF